MSMRMLVGTLIQVLLVVSVAQANPEAPEQCSEPGSILSNGRWALQFQVGNDFTLSSFQGSTISAKRQLSDRSAYRVGLQLAIDLDARDEEVTRTDYENDTSERDAYNQAIGLNMQYLRYNESTSPIKLFYGGGPFVVFQNSKTTSSEDDFTRETTSKVLGAGLNGLIGVEWFVGENISLHAEYGLELGYKWINQRQEKSTTYDFSNDVTSHSLDLRGEGVLFGVTAYL
jgi:hypothetical protein